jgi:tRNA threonylcarbamoyladenosine biosynthesis protein TsaB
MAMLVLALDTTTRAGSLALVRDDQVIEEQAGDPARTHGARLPGDILDLLNRHRLAIGDIDLYGVAAGPGSFTGLRIGIAAVQGLAFANDRQVVPVSALEALAIRGGADAPASSFLGSWMDAQRQEVFSALWSRSPGVAGTPGEPDHGLTMIEEAAVGTPADTLERWLEQLNGRSLALIGDGATAYRDVIAARAPDVSILPTVPPLAATIARLAAERAAAGGAIGPAAIRPLYVRRPDAELAREQGRNLQRMAKGDSRA